MRSLRRNLVNLEDARQRARHRLPRMVFDFVDGGAEDEVTMRRNRSAFEELVFRPHGLVDVQERSQHTTVLGRSIEMPVLLAPTGIARLVHRDSEVGAARAAADAGSIIVLSSMSSDSIEAVVDASRGRAWFQLYSCRERHVTEALLARARTAGVEVLCITIDNPVFGRRERDLRSGMTFPPRLRVGSLLDAALRPRWLAALALGRELPYGNFTGLDIEVPRGVLALSDFAMNQIRHPGRTWEEVEWIRNHWEGPVAIKGVTTAAVARRCVQIGADAVVVSNHGGRQLDGLPATIEALPEVVDAVDGRCEVLLDGGVRRGTDVVKALALGARACLIGRPWLYGLAIGGEAGVAAVLGQLSIEIDTTMGLLGCPSIASVDRRVVA